MYKRRPINKIDHFYTIRYKRLWLKCDRLTGLICKMSEVALKTSRQGTISSYLQTSKMYHSGYLHKLTFTNSLFYSCKINIQIFTWFGFAHLFSSWLLIVLLFWVLQNEDIHSFFYLGILKGYIDRVRLKPYTNF